ncbi:hypothetical protein QYE76_002446 [Lolium multiflorum]|uniref:Transposase (putative) gypsy type domain-containing protein n=1 Tax=Lolium multiflorum TaxID=4521 RepID=A0AAD8RLQ0_LOLMU|nr:hypothetical protein QYE76_002446 [Lolium multiflorum]
MYSDEEDTEEYTEHFEEDASSSTADVEEHVELYTDYGSASIANMTDIEELYTDYGSESIANMDDIDELYIDTCSTSMDDMVEHHHEDDIDPTIVPNIFGIDTLLRAPQGAIMRVPMHKIIDIMDIIWSIKSAPNMSHHLGKARTVIDSHHLMIVVDHHHLMVYIDILPHMIFDDTTQDMVMRQEDESLDMKTFLIRRLLPLVPPPQWPLPRHMPMDSDATSASNKATFHGNVPISYVSAKKLYFDELNAQVSKMPPLEDDLGGDGVEHGEHGILPSPTEAHGVEMVEHGMFPSTKEAHGDEQVEPTPTCLIDELVPIPCEHESHLAHLSESDSELSDFHPICEFECFHLEDMSDTQSSTEDEFPLMEKMYMVHEDDDISPCLLQDGHVDHMDPPTSTTPTSHESAYKGTDIDKDQERRNPQGAWKKEEEEGKKRRRKRKKRREEQAGQPRGRSDRATDRTAGAESDLRPRPKDAEKKGLLKKKKEALKFPEDESIPHPPIGFRVTFVDFLIRGLATPIHEFLRGLLFIYGIQLHQLTPNSLLHISIFITLCECFLGIHPHWGLWKHIFYLRRNNSRNVIYNIGGICICIRPDVDYFDVKFPDSVQGWRKKWMYIQDEPALSQEYGIAPFDPAEEIQRRGSWDIEATAEEKAVTEALMTRIHQLQNTDGEELSGVQIIAYFLRIRVQALQARKNPLWMYSGAKDVDRFSKDLSMKDLEKLVRHFTSMNKNNEVPSSCRVEPYSDTHTIPENHKILSSLPPQPEGGEVDGRVVIADDSQESSLPESEAAESQKSAGSSEKETGPEQHSESGHSISPPPATSPDGRKRKRDVVEDSCASKPAEPAAEESSLEEESAFDPFADASAVSLSEEGAEEGEPAAHGTGPTSTSNTLVLSEEDRTAAETSTPPQHNPETPTLVPSPRAPLPKKARTGAGSTQELVIRSTSSPLLEDLLMKELVNLGSQFIGFRDEAATLKGRMGEEYTLHQESDNSLLDTLAILELNCDLARTNISSARATLKRIFPHFFPKDTQSEIFSELTQRFLAKEDPVLAHRPASLKIGVEGTIVLVTTSGQEVN